MLRLAGGLKVSIQYEEIARVEFPGETIGLGVWDGSRFPEQKVAVGIGRIAGDGEIHTGKARTRRSLETPGRSSAINEQIGMMHDLCFRQAGFLLRAHSAWSSDPG